MKIIDLDKYEAQIKVTVNGQDRVLDKYLVINMIKVYENIALRASHEPPSGRSALGVRKTLLAVGKSIVALYKAYYRNGKVLTAHQIKRAKFALLAFDGKTERDRPDSQIFYLLKEMVSSWKINRFEERAKAEWIPFIDAANDFMDTYGNMGVSEPNEQKINDWRNSRKK